MRVALVAFCAASALSVATHGAEGREQRPTQEQCNVALVVTQHQVVAGKVFDPSPPTLLSGEKLPEGARLISGWGKGGAASIGAIRALEEAGHRTAFECREVHADLKRRSIPIVGNFERKNAPTNESIRIGLPAISQSGDEALVVITNRASGLSGMDRIFLLRRDPKGTWRLSSTNLLGIS